MTERFEQFALRPDPTPQRPLLGMTVLVVEDSRFASEAVRLLCLRSGARIRRADSLVSAQKHLQVYRPNIVIVDMGLPDGPGAELISDLSAAVPPVDVVLGMSGDSSNETIALSAGADGFIEKPVANLGQFQQMILQALPDDVRPSILVPVSNEVIAPDPVALQDDFVHIADLLTTDSSENTLDYIAQFLAGIAKSAGDKEVTEAAKELRKCRDQGTPYGSNLARVAGLVHARIEESAAV